MAETAVRDDTDLPDHTGSDDESAVNAALEASLAGVETAEDDSPEIEVEAAGDEATPEVSETPSGEDAAEGEGETPKEGEEAKAEPSAEAIKAKKQLRFHHFTDKQLGDMDDAEVLALWDKVSEKSSSDRRAHRERADLERKVEELETKLSETGATTDAGEQSTPTSAVDLTEPLKRIETEFGEEASEAFKDLNEKSVAPLRAELDELKQLVGQLRGGQAEVELRAARDEVGKEFPDFASDDEVYRRVYTYVEDNWEGERSKALDPPARLRRLMREGASVEGLSPASPDKELDNGRTPDEKQPTVGTRKPSRKPFKGTAEQMEERALSIAAEASLGAHTAYEIAERADAFRKGIDG